MVVRKIKGIEKMFTVKIHDKKLLYSLFEKLLPVSQKRQTTL